MNHPTSEKELISLKHYVDHHLQKRIEIIAVNDKSFVLCGFVPVFINTSFDGFPLQENFNIFGDEVLIFNDEKLAKKYALSLQSKFLHLNEIIKIAESVNEQIINCEKGHISDSISLSEYHNSLYFYHKSGCIYIPSSIAESHKNGLLHNTDIKYEIYATSPRFKTLKIEFEDNVKYFPQVEGKFISTRQWNYGNTILALNSLEESEDIIEMIENNFVNNNYEVNRIAKSLNLSGTYRNHCVFCYHYNDTN